MNLDLLVASLVSAGRLKGDKIKLDGRPMNAVAGDPGGDGTIKYLPSGWSEIASPTGGRRSKRADELSQKLYHKNFHDVSDRIPNFYNAVFAPATKTLSMNSSEVTTLLDPKRAKTPADRQGIENVRAAMNQIFAIAIATGYPALEKDYRGVGPGGIPRAMIGNDNNPATQRPWTAQSGSPASQAFDLDVRYRPWVLKMAPGRFYVNVDDPQEGMMNAMSTIPFVDHAILDLKTPSDTDEALGNILASFIKSIGIDLD